MRFGGALKGLLPVGVAAGVALVVGGGVDVVHKRQRAEKRERAASTSANSSVSASVAPSARPGKDARVAPRFVVGVRAGGTALVIRDVRDGGDAAPPLAAPPGRRFHRVAVAGDGDYVVSSYAARTVRFERLELDDEGRPEELVEIPKATVAGVSTAYSDLAVNPDGNRIAYVTYRGAAARVDIVNARTGARKAWTTRVPAHVGSLSWAGDTLAFVWNPLRVIGGKAAEIRHQVRTLDTRLPSGDLKLSKAVVDLRGGKVAVLARDGRTVISGLTRGSQFTVQAGLAGSRGPARILARPKGKGGVARLDADQTGVHLLVAATDGRLYTGGTPLPGRDLLDAAW